MRISTTIFGCLAILAAFSLPMPVYAQVADTGDAAMTAPPPDAHGKPDMAHEEWRAQHDDMEKMRSEREQLESDRDHLKMRCMDAKGQDRSDCEEKMQALHDRNEALHEKMKSLHDKREAERQKHHTHRKDWKENKGHKDGWNKHPQGASPSGHAAPPQTPPPSGETPSEQ